MTTNTESMSAQDAGDVAWAVTQIGDLKNIESWSESQLKRLQVAIDYFDNTFGMEKGPKVYQLAMQGAEATNSKDRLKYEKQLTTTVNNLASLTPVTPPEFKPSSLIAFGKGIQSSLVPYLPEGKGDETIREAQVRSETNPIATGAGQFVGAMLPPVATEIALGRIPGVNKLINKVLPGKGYGSVQARELLMSQGPVARAMAAGGITGAINRDESALMNAALGGIFTKAGEAVLGRFATKSSNKAVEEQRFLKRMNDKGFWVNPGLKSGRVQAMMLDDALRKNPNTANQVRSRLDHNQQLLNESVAVQLGLPRSTKYLGEETLNMQRNILNDKLDDFYTQVRPAFTSHDARIIPKIKKEYFEVIGEEVPPDLARRLASYKHILTTRAMPNNEALRTLIRRTSDRLTFHLTDPNGNREAAKGFGILHRHLTKRMRDFSPSRAKAREWRTVSEQQALLLDLAEVDKNLWITGKVNPHALEKLFSKGKSRKLDYINRRKEMADAVKFAKLQEESFENSLSMNQRLGHYLLPKQRTSNIGTLADLASSSQLPLVSTIPTAYYLSRGASGLLPASVTSLGGNIAGAYGAAGMPNLEFIPGLLNLPFEEEL